ncbi:MAG: hypothetical protein QW666_03855 [Candidatus Woesearchaeota archaeon]
MTIVGLNFSKIIVDRQGMPKGKISVTNNIQVKAVEKTDLAVGKAKQNALKFEFEFNAKYEPNIASIKLEGTTTYFDAPEKIEELEKAWKKDKKLPKEVMTPVLNNILTKCNIEALILSREVNLPPPMQLPSVQLK